jgi:hypothetical protein
MQEQVIAAALFEGPVNDAIVRLVGTYVLDQLNTERVKVEALEARLRELERKPSDMPEWVKHIRYMVLVKGKFVIGYTHDLDNARTMREAFRGAPILKMTDIQGREHEEVS